jgi:hypothetical protein
MATYTVPFTPDRYAPMNTVLKALRDAGVDEATINLIYPHVKPALREEIGRAVQQERERKTSP